jgi:tetratricopeptide (TPR) repeat protein
MKIEILALITAILLIFSANGLEMKTTAHVFGDGRMEANTFSNGVKDSISGSGDQYYKRSLSSNYDEDSASLASTYIYRRDLSSSDGKNTHFAGVDSYFGIEHDVSVTSWDTVTSTAQLIKSQNSVSTKFAADSFNGSLLETVINSRGFGPGIGSEIDTYNRVPELLAQTYLEGNYSFNSELNEEVVNELDAKGLMYKLNSVELLGDSDNGITDGVKIPKIYGGVARTPEDKAQTYYDEAIKWTAKAMDSKEESEKNKYLELALINISDSLEYYQESESYSALVQEGNILNLMGRYSEAIISLDKAINIKRDSYALYQKAANLMRLNRFSDAIPILKELELDNSYKSKAMNRLKTCYREVGKESGTYPTDPVLLAYKGLAEFYDGFEENAKTDLCHAIALKLEIQNGELYDEVRSLNLSC